jgi:transposase-like protein
MVEVVGHWFRGDKWLDSHDYAQEDFMGTKGYSAEFRRRVLDLVNGGRKVADVAADLGIGGQKIYNWRLQDRIDGGVEEGLTTEQRGELPSAKRRIAQLEAELPSPVAPRSC